MKTRPTCDKYISKRNKQQGYNQWWDEFLVNVYQIESEWGTESFGSFQVFITNKWLITHHWLQSYLFLAQMTPLIVTTVLSLKLVSLSLFSLLFPDLVEVSTFEGRLWTPQVSMDFLNKITAIVAVLEKNKCVFIINKKPELGLTNIVLNSH